ncbi:hypothetical protein [Roseiconus lacunae]|uniref:Uncharacterized protein n=1 Tax=Roseiconus lacunae TaxID=2605694 RepID=A0ABT7PEN7_9BACT|nr:hypothetical protein [Roseiconus lacunae]MDM4014686.1 hypothetical protein [Roseiconus lacunae]
MTKSETTNSGIHRRQELRFVERALRGGWNVTDEQRAIARDLADEVLDDDGAFERERQAAERVLSLLGELPR